MSWLERFQENRRQVALLLGLSLLLLGTGLWRFWWEPLQVETRQLELQKTQWQQLLQREETPSAPSSVALAAPATAQPQTTISVLNALTNSLAERQLTLAEQRVRPQPSLASGRVQELQFSAAGTFENWQSWWKRWQAKHPNWHWREILIHNANPVEDAPQLQFQATGRWYNPPTATQP